MRTSYDLIAVDLDGTLVDSAPDLTFCVGSALSTLGFSRPSAALTRSWIGDGIDTLISRALTNATGETPTPAAVSAALTAFDRCYRENLFRRSRLYPEVTATLDALRGAGSRLCCITNKRIAYTLAQLDQAGIRERFELVYGGDSFDKKKPHPQQLTAASEHFAVAASSALMVGDSTHDCEAAIEAGFSFAWAAYGYCPSLDRSLEGIVTIHKFAELRDLANG